MRICFGAHWENKICVSFQVNRIRSCWQFYFWFKTKRTSFGFKTEEKIGHLLSSYIQISRELESSTLRKLYFQLLSNWMGYNRGDSFPFDFDPNGFPFGSKSNRNSIQIHIPFNLKGNRNIVFSVKIPECVCSYVNLWTKVHKKCRPTSWFIDQVVSPRWTIRSIKRPNSS